MKLEPIDDRIGQCVLCKLPFAIGGNSQEHIIPNAIGGRKKIRGFLCRECNSTTGQEWDSELTNQLKPLCNLLEIKRERGSVPDVIVETLDGQRIRLKSGGRMTMDRVEITEEETDGRIHVKFSGPTNKKVIKKHLTGLVRKYPQLKGADLMRNAVIRKEYNSSPMEIDLKFGGLDAGRSAVKSCVALAHMSGLHLDNLEQAREYLCGKSAPCFGFYNETDVVTNRPEDVFFHCVHVQGNDQTGKVLGYVEYFGFMRIVVQLSDAYGGPPFTQTYAVNPVVGKDIELNVKLPNFTTHQIQDIYDYKKVNPELCGKGIGSLIESYLASSRDREIERIFKDAHDYGYMKCDIEPGKSIPEKKVGNFRSHVYKRLIELLEEFVVHQLKPLDIEQVNRKIKAG